MLWIALALALWGLARAEDTPTPTPETDDLAQVIGSAPVSRDWQDWLLAKAWIETRWNPSKLNFADGPKAREAAERLRGEGRLPACRGLDEYAFSGGAWQIIPAIFLVVAYPKNEAMLCVDPRIVVDPRESLAMVLAYAGKLQTWSSYQENPTFETLWLGFQSPSFMADSSSKRAQKSLENMRKGLARIGREDLAKKRPPKLSKDGSYWRNLIVLGGQA